MRQGPNTNKCSAAPACPARASKLVAGNYQRGAGVIIANAAHACASGHVWGSGICGSECHAVGCAQVTRASDRRQLCRGRKPRGGSTSSKRKQ